MDTVVGYIQRLARVLGRKQAQIETKGSVAGWSTARRELRTRVLLPPFGCPDYSHLNRAGSYVPTKLNRSIVMVHRKDFILRRFVRIHVNHPPKNHRRKPPARYVASFLGAN